MSIKKTEPGQLLSFAIKHGYWDIVREILSQKLQSSGVWTPEGDSVLHLAVKCRDAGIVKKILKKNGGLACVRNDRGQTPLHVAVRQMASVKRQLACVKDDKGNVSLLLAVRQGCAKVVNTVLACTEIVKAILEASPGSVLVPDNHKDKAHPGGWLPEDCCTDPQIAEMLFAARKTVHKAEKEGKPKKKAKPGCRHSLTHHW